MTTAIVASRWILRIAFLVSVIVGFVLWSGHGYKYLSVHMWSGFIITFDLLLIVIVSLLARVRPALPLITLVFAIALPVFGIGQLRLLPGPNHWLIRVLHLLLGLAAIGVGEALAKRAWLAQPSRAGIGVTHR